MAIDTFGENGTVACGIFETCRINEARQSNHLGIFSKSCHRKMQYILGTRCLSGYLISDDVFQVEIRFQRTTEVFLSTFSLLDITMATAHQLLPNIDVIQTDIALGSKSDENSEFQGTCLVSLRKSSGSLWANRCSFSSTVGELKTTFAQYNEPGRLCIETNHHRILSGLKFTERYHTSQKITFSSIEQSFETLRSISALDIIDSPLPTVAFSCTRGIYVETNLSVCDLVKVSGTS